MYESQAVTEELRQREPRVRNDRYLAWLRTLPCCISGKNPPSDAAHIRSGSIKYNKRPTGGSEKASDRWALPLSREVHAELHSMNELAFFEMHKIDPFYWAEFFYATFLLIGGSHKETKKRKSPKIKSGSKFPKGRKIVSRGFNANKNR